MIQSETDNRRSRLRRRRRGRRRARFGHRRRDQRPLPLESGTPDRSLRTGARRSSTSTSAAIRTTPAKVESVLAAVDDVQAAHPELFIGSFGISADEEIDAAFFDDLKKAGVLSLPVTLIILIVVFGASVAAGIPLLLALSAIVAAFGLVGCRARSCRSTRWSTSSSC